MEALLLEDTLPLLGSGETPRTPGLHLTDVIEDLGRTSGLIDNDSKWERDATIGAGFIWEEVLARLLGDKLSQRLGEVTLDGIIGTPDGLDVENMVLEEYKFTWKSSNHDPLDNWRYMTQVMAYCKMVGTTQCKLRIYHVMGNYKGSGPQYRCWLITFQPHEIDETWSMLLNHKKVMERRT